MLPLDPDPHCLKIQDPKHWLLAQVLLEAPGEPISGGQQAGRLCRQEEDQGAEGPRRQSCSKPLCGPRDVSDNIFIYLSIKYTIFIYQVGTVPNSKEH